MEESMRSESTPTSRIIIKNLPKWANEDRLRKHFGTKGHITDLKLIYTRNGIFRQFAYLGYSSVEEAVAAVKYFNQTFVDTSRIQVEFAHRLGSEYLSRPWSKYSEGSSAHKEYLEKKKEMMAAITKNTESAQETPKEPGLCEKKKRLLASILGEDDNALKTFVAGSKSKKLVWENDADNIPTDMDVEKGPKTPVSDKATGPEGQVDASSRNSSIQNDPEDLTAPANQNHNERDLKVESIAETGRLFVRNLSYACTEDDLKRLFEPFGPLTEVHLSISRESRKPKGFAYILFMFPDHALRAFSELDGTIFLGRILHILPALERPESNNDDGNDKSTSFRTEKEKQQKEKAHNDYNWNSLFLRSDTVMDAIAAKLGVPKSSLVDVKNENLAAKLAIAETNLIQETKSYLEAEGVVLEAFALRHQSERSDRILLAKNLPWETDSADLFKLFGKFGALGRVILPPTHAMAVIEFMEPSEARSAFRALAYSRFKAVPLFLEWAPVAALKPLSVAETTDAQSKAVKIVKTNVSDTVFDAEEESTILTCTTLYVKNLNFSTTTDTLKTVFSAVGPIRSVKIATKKKEKAELSLGFGFIEFERKESLNRALDQLQGTVIDGHALILKKSTNTAPSSQTKKRDIDTKDAKGDNDPQLCKLLIKNIPFEASEQEVRELFSTFAQLKRLRIPRRYDGRHRGFGFVEFLTHKEAQNAKRTLAHTHLYGRHLVIEWAQAEAGDAETEITELRAKAIKEADLLSRKNFDSPRTPNEDEEINDDSEDDEEEN